MRRLLPLFLLLFTLPALAGLFDDPAPRGVIDDAPLNNSSDFLPVREAFRLSLVSSDAQSVKLRFVAAEGYYLYRHQFKFRIEPSDLAKGEARLPAGKPKHDQYFGDVEVYYGITDVELPLDNPIDLPFTVHVSYQGCADKGLCYPPENERVEVDGQGAAPTEPAASTAPSAPAQAGWTWKELALFFLGGLALTFTPCVLPMLPILTGVVLRGQPGGTRGLVLSLAYVLPMALSFAILGALMGLFGAELNLQARLQSPWVLVPFAIFFALFGAASLGFLELRLPMWLRRLITRGLAIIPAVAGVLIAGDSGATQLLVLSQVVLSLQLPFAVLPLVAFTGSRRLMGSMAAPRWLIALAWGIAAVIVLLNGWMLWGMMTGQG